MDHIRDADGFLVPTVPASSGSRSRRAGAESVTSWGVSSGITDSTRSSPKTLVENPHYRTLNLAANHIFLRTRSDPILGHIADLVARIGRDRDSPAPALDEVSQDRILEGFIMGVAEPDVQMYFSGRIFPHCSPGGVLYRCDRQPMAKHTVPNVDSKLRISTPVPDLLYGYRRFEAFCRKNDAVSANSTCTSLYCDRHASRLGGKGPKRRGQRSDCSVLGFASASETSSNGARTSG